jgi:EAL domain-containing protein (putative c-di-GMP-specific phosphodiesterase class I)
VYSASIDEYGPRRLALSADLRHAIATGGIQVHYQPKALVPSGDVVGVEALARWVHPSEGYVPPDEFIPIAERSGLIRELTDLVLRESLSQCRAWRDRGWPMSVAVNLSTRTLLDPDLPAAIGRHLSAARVPSAALILEITEGSVMSDPERAVATLAKLRMMGVSIAVDDFGTGYSSLSYLKRLPVDEVKIDKSFVQTLTLDNSDAKIVRSIIDLGHNLGLTVVAEGVEDLATWTRLAELGCTQAQGFYLSRAIPPAELVRWLQARRTAIAAPALHVS